MATITFNAYSASVNGSLVSIALCFGEPPFASRTIEAKNVVEIAAAFETYKADAAATGKALACTMMLKRGDRAPNGFKALKAARSYDTVNC